MFRLFTYIGLEIGFTQTQYPILESISSLELCAQIESGLIASDLMEISLEIILTADGTAGSKCIHVDKIYSNVYITAKISGSCYLHDVCFLSCTPMTIPCIIVVFATVFIPLRYHYNNVKHSNNTNGHICTYYIYTINFL